MPRLGVVGDLAHAATTAHASHAWLSCVVSCVDVFRRVGEAPEKRPSEPERVSAVYVFHENGL